MKDRRLPVRWFCGSVVRFSPPVSSFQPPASSILAVREPAPSYHTEGVGSPHDRTSDERPATSDRNTSLSEAVLVRLWAGQRFPAAALVTCHGVPVRVLHPGRRGRGPGPDFRDALVAAPSGGVLRGDVELHLRASDFLAHGHHRDERYDGLVLHVVFEDDAEEDTALASAVSSPESSSKTTWRTRPS